MFPIYCLNQWSIFTTFRSMLPKQLISSFRLLYYSLAFKMTLTFTTVISLIILSSLKYCLHNLFPYLHLSILVSIYRTNILTFQMLYLNTFQIHYINIQIKALDFLNTFPYYVHKLTQTFVKGSYTGYTVLEYDSMN